MDKVELYNKLSEKIPEEYLIEYTEDGKTFTGFEAQYAINLLNETLGLDGWVTDEEILQQGRSSNGWTVVMKIKISGQYIDVSGYGAGEMKTAENAYKAAKTSAFKNACRYLGIGKELYNKNNYTKDDVVKSNEEINTGDDSTEFAKFKKLVSTMTDKEKLSCEIKSLLGNIGVSKEEKTLAVDIFNKRILELDAA